MTWTTTSASTVCHVLYTSGSTASSVSNEAAVNDSATTLTATATANALGEGYGNGSNATPTPTPTTEAPTTPAPTPTTEPTAPATTEPPATTTPAPPATTKPTAPTTTERTRCPQSPHSNNECTYATYCIHNSFRCIEVDLGPSEALRELH